MIQQQLVIYQHRARTIGSQHQRTMSSTVSLQHVVLWCTLLAAMLCQPVAGLRFIAAPLLAISPAMDLMGVVAQLHSRGHEVLVLVTPSALAFVKSAAARHSSNTTAEGLHYLLVDVHYSEFEKPKPLKAGEVPKPSVFAVPDRWPQSALFKMTSGVTMLQMFQPGIAFMAAQLLGNATLMEHLHGFRADAWMGVGIPTGSVVRDNTGCIMGHALGVHVVDINGNTFFEGPLAAPQFGTMLMPEDLQTLPGRVLNAAAWATYQLASLSNDLSALATDKLRRQYGLPLAGSPCALTEGLRRLRGLKSVRCEPLIQVMMATWLVEHPRTLPPNVVLAGPGTPRPAHAISPPEVAAFVNTAPQGIVLAAFGTVYGTTLRPEDMHELAKGFAALAPVRVLWALRPAALRSGIELSELPIGSNTMVVPWVDYNDVLGHPATKVFVSHCGMHSVNEAAYHGVPLVAIPFQMEQAEHAMKLEARGAAVICKQSLVYRRGAAAAMATTFTAEQIAGLIREVMLNASYAEAAHSIGLALQRYAAQRHPYDRAADEVELAILAAGVRTPVAVPPPVTAGSSTGMPAGALETAASQEATQRWDAALETQPEEL